LAWGLLLWIGCALLPVTLWAQTAAVKVLILPLRVYAEAPDPALGSQMVEVPANRLTEAGATVEKADLTPEALVALLDSGPGAILDYARRQEADYAIWGSATWIGQQFSIDSRLVETLSGQTETFFYEGRRTEDMGAVLASMARDVVDRIFRREKIASIEIEGNQRIEADAIQRVIRSAAGDAYDPKVLGEDLKAVFGMGYFDDIRVESETVAGGKQVTFVVKEKPTLRTIRIKGNRALDDEKIREVMTLRTGSIVNVKHIRNNIERIETLYKDKNYHNVQVTHAVLPLENNQADLELTIAEGEKVRIEEIVFEGNAVASDKQLKKLIKTSEASMFSWITSAGELKQEVLNQDVGQILAYYNNDGYIQAKVADPVVEYLPEGIRVTFKIDEGPRYGVGAVTVSGDLVRPAPELIDKLRIVKEPHFSRETVRNDVLMLTDLYSDEGYAYAEIVPKVEQHPDTLKVDIDFAVAKGPLVYFEKIVIAGNTKTRDKVIRRELEVYEQELYNGAKLKKGVRNLFRLDYFEDVKVDTTKGTSDDSMVLKVDVTEKPTGAFTFGGGYSSVEDAFTMFSISQRNFRGRGQVLQARAQLGGVTNKFSLSFTEPWLFDIPLSATVEAYNWEVDYDYYDKDSIGAGLRLSYPFWENVRLYWGYRIDLSEVTAISTNASESIWQMEGENLTSSTEVAIRYDSRNRLFNPTEGSMHGISLEYAGLGGDVGFIKTEAETGRYFPLSKKLTGFLRAKGGMIEDVSGKLLPDYEKFYLGGINSLRGFRWEDLAPKEPSRHPYYPGELVEVGGDKYVQFNAELIFPIDEKSGVMGVVFFDTGEVFGSNENVDFGQLRESIGAGFRWYSPIGPIRVEYGHILDPKDGFGEGGRWEFTMGTAF
jgi:outer membrane protein insertion porin family